MFENLNDTIRGVFLLIIAVSANLLGNTLNCNLQLNLTNIPYLRHLFLYLIIIFTIDFTSKNSMSIVEILTKSLIIYIFYILLSKQNYITLYIIIILLIAVYLCYIQSNYLINLDKNNEENIYNTVSEYLTYLIGIVAIIGFAVYFTQQYNDHYDDFDFLKFIFGTNKCDKL